MPLTKIGEREVDVAEIIAALNSITLSPKQAERLNDAVADRIREPEPEFLTTVVQSAELLAGDVITRIDQDFDSMRLIYQGMPAAPLFLRFTVRRKNPDWKP